MRKLLCLLIFSVAPVLAHAITSARAMKVLRDEAGCSVRINLGAFSTELIQGEM